MFLIEVSVDCRTQHIVEDPESVIKKIDKEGVRHEYVSKDESNQKKWRRS